MTVTLAVLLGFTWAWIAAGRFVRWRIERKVLTAYGVLLNVKPGRWETNRAARARMVSVMVEVGRKTPGSFARFARAMTQRPEDKPN